jgi:hypothetical protein
MEIKEDWARFIIGQALVEIKTKDDIPRIIKKVESTAVGVRKDLMRAFLKMVEAKEHFL